MELAAPAARLLAGKIIGKLKNWNGGMVNR